MGEKIEENKTYMNLEIKTWEKDSNGLYDYFSQETKDITKNLDEKMDIIRKNQEIKLLSTTEIENNDIDEENILRINKEEEIYTIENDLEKNMEQNNENINKINNKLFYVFNNDKDGNMNIQNKNRNKNYYLIKNDLIKLGRNKLILTEANIHSGDKIFELTVPSDEETSSINIKNFQSEPVFNLIKKANYYENNNKNKDNNNSSEEKVLCKICFSEQTDIKNNPLVHLCKCKGDINFAHFKCIKRWMKTKLYVYVNLKKTVKTYFIPRFNCEICKEPYPYRFTLNNNSRKKYELIDVIKPRHNHIILESLNQIKDGNYNNKYVHVISLENENEIIIGRGINADLRINDISVSREHCSLKFNFEKKTLLIKDLKSKFGTSVLIRNSIELKQKEYLNIQVGRSFICANVILKENFDNLNDKEITNEGKEDEKLEEEQLYPCDEEIAKLFNNNNCDLININNKFIINLDNEINQYPNHIDDNNHNNNMDDDI